jgi:NhaP-type Na+/H+ and K+/H+ antiporter
MRPMRKDTFPPDAAGSQVFCSPHLAFFVVLASVLLQGTTVSLVGKWLGVLISTKTPEAASEH